MGKNSIINTLRIAGAALKELKANDPLRMAGATAFFSTFALPPIVIIIVRVLGLFFNRRTMGLELLKKLEGVVGPEGREQVLATIRGVRALQQNWMITAGIFIFLLFVATTLFKVIKSSLNQIWDIRTSVQRNFRQLARSRLHAIGVLGVTSLLFLFVLATDSLQALLGQYLDDLLPAVASYVDGAFDQVVSVIVVTIWFFMIFFYLPDGRPHPRIALGGAFLTSILFNIGKLVLRTLLTGGNIGSLYGTSGALVLLLLFVFYSSMILYFGASYIKVWSRYRRLSIQPLPHAIRYYLSHITISQEGERTFHRRK